MLGDTKKFIYVLANLVFSESLYNDSSTGEKHPLSITMFAFYTKLVIR